MNADAKQVLEQALHLSTQERAAVAEGLLYSLDKPDPGIDKAWIKEVEARIDAYERGEMETIGAGEVMAKYSKP